MSGLTPETDTFAAHMSEEFIDPSWLKFSQELERERDEARNQRDILRLDAQKEAEHHDRMVGELEKVYAERDEARKESEYYKARYEQLKEGREMSDRPKTPKWFNGREIPADIKEGAK